MKQKTSKIANFSLAFISRYKATLLISLALVGIGFFSYTTLLKREGFPVINIPVVLVQTPYLSGSPEKTELDVTSKISDALKSVEKIETIETTSTESFSTVLVRFLPDFENINDAANQIEDQIKSLDGYGTTIIPNIVIPNAAKIDGVNDLIFSIYSNTKSPLELQQLGERLTANLEEGELVKDVNIIKQIETRKDVRSSKEVIVKTSFSRVGVSEEGKINFYDALNIGVVKANDNVGTIEFSTEVRNIVNDTLNKDSLLSDIKVSYGGDFADSLKSQISSLESNALAAILTITIVLFFFINLRASVILGIFIPLTLGAVFITFYLIGYSLNTISLFALILVLGLFVDDGTVVVEAIDYYKRKGFKGKAAVAKAVNDIGIADISGTLTTLLVFVPLVFISGVLGDFIRLLPVTVIISLALSLLIALTILPLISLVLIPDSQKKSKNKVIYFFQNALGFIPNSIVELSRRLSKIVYFVVSRKIYIVLNITISIAVIVIGSSFAAKIGFEFFAQSKDADTISVTASTPGNNNVDLVKEQAIKLEQLIANNLEDVITKVNYFGANAQGFNLRIELTPIGERELTALNIAAKINELGTQIEDVNISASSLVAGPPVQQFPFAMQVFAESTDTLMKVTDEISEFILGTPLNKNVGVNEVQVQNLNGISEIDGKRFAQIRAKFTGDSDSATLLELQNKIINEFTPQKLADFGESDIKLGFDLGQESDNAESFSSVVFAGLVALLVMYVLLVVQFNSFTQPLLILVAIPFSFPGLFIGLYLTNNPMSFFVVVGLTGLIGIVVNNTIMLLEYANTRRREGFGIRCSIAKAIELRFRPILATSTTTIAGLLPLALTEPFWEPLAFTIIFGLLSSVAMVLIAFPAFYITLEKLRELTKFKLSRLF